MLAYMIAYIAFTVILIGEISLKLNYNKFKDAVYFHIYQYLGNYTCKLTRRKGQFVHLQAHVHTNACTHHKIFVTRNQLQKLAFGFKSAENLCPLNYIEN